MDSKSKVRSEKSKNLGITSSKDLQKCTGNKIISMDILNSVLSTLAYKLQIKKLHHISSRGSSF